MEKENSSQQLNKKFMKSLSHWTDEEDSFTYVTSLDPEVEKTDMQPVSIWNDEEEKGCKKVDRNDLFL